MKIDVLTLFPKMFENILGESMLKRAQKKGIAKIVVHNLRDWTSDSHHSADDKPFGGGPGMVMKIEPVYSALREFRAPSKSGSKVKERGRKVILLTPQGRRLDQAAAKRLSASGSLVLICGHYEGIDERIRDLADEEVSIGDYVLTCGELPALVLIDAVVRLLPGVLGDKESLNFESFEDGLLEYPQYTRPAEFKGMKVPDIVVSGDHKKIKDWRMREAIKRTEERRPDLIKTKKEKRHG